jgi:hypothetical protein
MIKLTDLLTEEKAFTATNKETGNVSVFKSKAARDAAVKAGSHEKRKTDKDDAVDVPTGKKKPNMFSKDVGYAAGDAKSDEPKKSEPSKYDSEYFADDEKLDSVGYDSDTGDTYYNDDDEGLAGYKKTVERLNKVERALDDELKLSDNGFTTARQSGGGGGYYEGPLEIYGDNAIDDDGYPREGAVTLSIGSGENNGNFSIALTSLEDGMNVFDGPYSITGDRELSAEESFKLGKTLMKMPEMQKFLKGEISKEEFQPIYTKLVSKFGKSTKNETTMKLKNLLPINEGQHKKFERQLKNLQKIIKIDLSEALEVLEEDGVLESIDHLEIAVERLQGMIKDLKRIR